MGSSNCEVAVVGGGVIGLSLAWELARRGAAVCVLDRGVVGRESSWAGAGIIYPADLGRCRNPFDRLRAESYARWPAWADRLRAETGIDSEFLRSGSILLDHAHAALARLADELRCETTPLTTEELARLEPALQVGGLAARLAPGVCQVRNPRLLRALRAACESADVSIVENAEAAGLSADGVLLASGERIHARQTVVCAGAWSRALSASLGADAAIAPVRGQLLSLRAPNVVRRIVEAGKNYLVPRADGLVLVGSTEEYVGFDKSTTEEALAELRAFAVRLFPALAHRPVEHAWAGLRPGSPSGVPYLARAPDRENLWIAAGHHRMGLQLSVGTAALLADWLTGSASFATPEDFGFRADRAALATSFSA